MKYAFSASGSSGKDKKADKIFSSCFFPEKRSLFGRPDNSKKKFISCVLKLKIFFPTFWEKKTDKSHQATTEFFEMS